MNRYLLHNFKRPAIFTELQVGDKVRLTKEGKASNLWPPQKIRRTNGVIKTIGTAIARVKWENMITIDVVDIAWLEKIP